jgi:predicted metal-dependent phosphoesterase TrpH
MTHRVDLHMHSTASDGTLSPAELVQRAQARGLTTIALTDHDTTDGLPEAIEAGRALGLEVITGLEINSETDLGHMDFLAYGVDGNNAALQDQLLAIRDARVGRAKGIVKKLADLGVPVQWERVLAFAGEENKSIARPHIARAMLEAGHVASLQEAFDKYLNDDGPAYVHRLQLLPQEVIDVIHQAGGAIVLAHPIHAGTDHLVPMLAGLGLDGVEVYYPDHSEEQRATLLAVAQQHHLIVTGGSDFHAPGDDTHADLGSVAVPDEVAPRLKERIQTRQLK